ncbi:MAG: UxaA family hydrolase [Proteobacteria bacterium]|nr:UxaA family hydrolase [Pseudomonadota bacterium]
MTTIDPRLLQIDPSDNILVARARLAAGEAIEIGAARVTLASDLPIGQKLAGRRIAAGEKILKYGAPIGSATADIAPGEHVHVHNMKSEYTPTYHLGDAKTNQH